MTLNKNKYCNNCGKYGHVNKSCIHPVTSIGILCFKSTNTLKINYKDFERYVSKKYIKIDNYNYEHIDNLFKLDLIKNNIKFLLIRRKNSLNYIEFIRGKYEKNDNEKLVSMFELMTKEEIKKIKDNDFEYLWNELWKKTSNYKIYQKEFNKSKKKFNQLVHSKKIDKLLQIEPLYDSAEWGIPKGRRNNHESNIDCAIREFTEETNIDKNNYKILTNLHCIQENYTGTNGIDYKHIYYLSIADCKYKLKNIIDNNYEIGDIGWFTWEECIKLIRPYYNNKLELINKIFLLISNLIFEYNDYNNYLNISI